MSQRKQQQKPAARGAKPKPELVPPTPETTEAPDWVNETPDDTEYCLTMHDQEFQAQQQVSLTRGEFIRLKRWLAALRGYDLRSPVDWWTANNLRRKSEDEQKAAMLEITQEEIEILIDVERVADALALNFRRRLKLGAAAESGKWAISDEASDPEFYDKGFSGCFVCGLDIHHTPETKTSTAGS